MSKHYLVGESSREAVRLQAAQFLEKYADAVDTDEPVKLPITFEAHQPGDDSEVTVIFIADSFARWKAHAMSTNLRGDVVVEGEDDEPAEKQRGLLMIWRDVPELEGVGAVELEVLDEDDLPVY